MTSGKEIKEFLKDIVAIPSLSGDEEAVADRIKKEFLKLGYESVFEDCAGNICGVRGEGDLKILYDAHMDVVEPGEGWDAPPYEPREKDGYIIGRGTVDDKGPLSSMIYGGAQADVDGVTLYVLASVNEEVSEGNGLKEFFKDTGIKPDVVVIGEPSELTVATGNRGRIGLRIDIKGKSGHASDPNAGDNALLRAANVVPKIDEINAKLEGESVAVTKIETPNKNINIIPEKCSFYLDYRSKPGTQKKDIIDKFEKLLESRDKIVATTPYYRPWVVEEKSSLIKAAVKTQKKVLNKKDIKFWPFCTNGSYSAGELNIPTFGFGPGVESQCHTSSEKIKVKDLEVAAEYFAALPKMLCDNYEKEN